MKRPHILVIEDDEDTRDTLSKYFKGIGYSVTACEKAETAIPKLSEVDYSAIVTDYHLPGMDGIELIRHAKKQFPAIPCMVITGQGEIATAVEAMNAGAFNFLEKPINIDVLEGLIREASEKAELALEVQRLRRQLDTQYGLTSLVGSSASMQKLFDKIKLAAPTNSTVLITGESGTGKELVSRAMHQCSQRKDSPFIAINCGALPESLVESELFGHEKGAFTGATSQKKGFFEAAEGGTLLIDEIGDMPLNLQSRLLRTLEQRTITRVGSTSEVPVNVRIVAATHRDLDQMVKEDRFRQDLFYRLSIIRLEIPPLRDRKTDIPILASHFLQQFAEENKRDVAEVSPVALDALTQYPWPGNVRELRNILESMVVLNTTGKIGTENVPAYVLAGFERPDDPLADESTSKPATEPAEPPPSQSGRTLADIEKDAIVTTLEDCGGNRTKAAQVLGIGIRTIQRKLKEYGLADQD